MVESRVDKEFAILLLCCYSLLAHLLLYSVSSPNLRGLLLQHFIPNTVLQRLDPIITFSLTLFETSSETCSRFHAQFLSFRGLLLLMCFQQLIGIIVQLMKKIAKFGIQSVCLLICCFEFCDIVLLHSRQLLLDLLSSLRLARFQFAIGCLDLQLVSQYFDFEILLDLVCRYIGVRMRYSSDYEITEPKILAS